MFSLSCLAREAHGRAIGGGWDDLGNVSVIICEENELHLTVEHAQGCSPKRALPVCRMDFQNNATGAGWRCVLELAGRVCWPLELRSKPDENFASRERAQQWAEQLQCSKNTY